jgi:thymidylate kinase
VHIRRGEIVIFDRYTYDAGLAAPRDPRILRRTYRALLARTCPDPDLVVVLDLPAEVAQRRKEEHSLASLTEARRRYLEVGEMLPQAVVVDASRSAHDVQREVEGLVRAAYSSRRERA